MVLHFVQTCSCCSIHQMDSFDIQIEAVCGCLRFDTLASRNACLRDQLRRRLDSSQSIAKFGGKVYEFAILNTIHVQNTLASFCIYFHQKQEFKVTMDAFLRGQSSAGSSLKLKQQASEEAAGPSSKRVIVPWVEK